MLLLNTNDTEETDATTFFLGRGGGQTLLTLPMLYIIYLSNDVFLFILFPA